MNTAHYTLSKVWAPLQDIWRRALPSVVATHEYTHWQTQNNRPRFLSARNESASFFPEATLAKHFSTVPHRPLRVVRIIESDHAPENVGRMMISGRMADVCAELDRLAANEAAVH